MRTAYSNTSPLPPTQAHLLPAAVQAFAETGKIQETEVHRFLDLVGVFSSEQYPGDMRLDQF
jgi:hypothetical protein